MDISNHSNRAVKAGIGYTIGNILVKGISFVTLPLFSRLMTPNEFGAYNVFLSYESILFVLMGFAIHTSIRSASIEFRGEIDSYTSSVSLIYILNLILFLAVAFLFGEPLGRLMGFSKCVLCLLALHGFGSAILTLFNNRIALDYSYKKYLTIALINTVFNVGLSLFLIVTIFKESKDVGRILGSTLTLFILSSSLLASFYRKAKPVIRKRYYRFAIQYSLPIVPHGISQILLAQFDRIMIRSLVSDSAAGIYSLAGNMKLILTLISDSISTAWATWFYEQIDKGNIADIQALAKQLCGMFAVLSIGLMALSPELILFLGGEKYLLGRYVAIPMIADAFLLFIYSVIVQIEYYKKKTIYVMTGTIIVTIINVITNYIFIKKYGFIAAAYTTLFSYLVYLVMHFIISKKLAGFYILNIKSLLLFSGILTVCAVIDLIYTESIIIRWSGCLLTCVPMIIWLLRKTNLKAL